jgi:uncharacterized damage-inducible protein DinB
MSKGYLVVEVMEGYAPEIGRWLGAMEDTRQRTKERLEGLRPELIDWGTAEVENSIGTLLYHIAAIEIDWLYCEVLQQEFPPEVVALFPYDVRDEQGRLTVVKGLSLPEHLHRLDTTRAIFLKSFVGMTTEEFRRVRQLKSYDVTPEWVIHHLMQHEAEHRGHIGTARLLGERAGL